MHPVLTVVLNRSITVDPIDFSSISLDQDLNSHKSGFQEFTEVYLIIN